MATQTVFHSTRVLLEDGLQEAAVVVGEDGKISDILTGAKLEQMKTLQSQMAVVNVGDRVLMPGVVDSHVHVNEPGRTEWEGFWSATRAAAAGGVTTIVDMPLNSIPPTTTCANLATKVNAARGQLHVDVAFWGGVVPGNQAQLRQMVGAGVVGFKCFMCPSGVDEFGHVNEVDLHAALQELQGTDAVLANLFRLGNIFTDDPLVMDIERVWLFHAECCLGEEGLLSDQDNPREYKTFLKSRPPSMEEEAVKLVAEMCTKYNVRCHVVHVSASDVLPAVVAAKAAGARLTAETCHHYLTLTAESVPNGAVEYKCCPPIRGADNQEKLWSALKDGGLDLVVSDHSPCVPSLKNPVGAEGDFMAAWGGISSLQFGLSLFWTEARKRGFTLSDVSRLMSENPAKLAGLKSKGQLKQGMDADFIIWDPDQRFKVEKSIILHKNKMTPYLGRTLHGRVLRTVVRGITVYELDHAFPSPQGKTILKTAEVA